jgi:hypothetical protein
LEYPAREKRSGLLQTFLNYRRKKVYGIGPSVKKCLECGPRNCKEKDVLKNAFLEQV